MERPPANLYLDGFTKLEHVEIRGAATCPIIEGSLPVTLSLSRVERVVLSHLPATPVIISCEELVLTDMTLMTLQRRLIIHKNVLVRCIDGKIITYEDWQHKT